MEEELLNEWQERLGLQDWIITLTYNCIPEQMNLQDVDGEVTVLSDNKIATIRILKKELYEGITDYDFEEILVHELLHCKFDVLDFRDKSYEGEVANVIRHQLIDDISRALVMAKRGETKRKLGNECKRIKDNTERS